MTGSSQRTKLVWTAPCVETDKRSTIERSVEIAVATASNRVPIDHCLTVSRQAMPG